METAKICIIYITTKDIEEARFIGKHLVQSHLAACVNIIDQMNSLYVWDGKFQDDTEAVMIAKTSEAKVASVIEAVRQLHSYKCPCVLTLPVTDGNPDFLTWINNQVGL